jgi:SAM-dependent MidA family methyltransferase
VCIVAKAAPNASQWKRLLKLFAVKWPQEAFCPSRVSWNSPFIVLFMDITKQKKTIPDGAAISTQTSALANCFGQLLAFQFAEWLETEVRSQKSEVRIVEAGAHDGQLAKDILNWLQSSRPKLFGQIQYAIIEPSARRQEWQKEKLAEFTPRVRWFADFQSLLQERTCHSSPATRHPPLRGVIFSNELLDAMPLRRFGWDTAKKKWFEWGVALMAAGSCWTRLQNLQPEPSLCPQPSGSALIRFAGQLHRRNLSRRRKLVARSRRAFWQHGKLLTIDYGLTADELFSPARTNGTLRAYFRHHASADILANVGGQDLTAHVNFSAIQKAGESAGLKTEMFSTQTQFLTQILEKTQSDKTFGEWTSARTRQFQTLTHPEHLGRAFRVLIQSR